MTPRHPEDDMMSRESRNPFRKPISASSGEQDSRHAEVADGHGRAGPQGQGFSWKQADLQATNSQDHAEGKQKVVCP